MKATTSAMGKAERIFKIFLVLASLYLFLTSVSLMGAAFGGFGEGFAKKLIQITSNPFVGLFIGVLATSLVQSSSTTTSIAVGMVSSGALTISNAIPIIMGANIGTTITCFVVSLAHFGRKEEFRRAISGAAVLVFFCIFCAFLLLPLEIGTGFLHKTSARLVDIFEGFGGITFVSPLEAVTKPAVAATESFLSRLPFLTVNLVYSIMLFLAVAILFLSLYFIVKIMRSMVVGRVEAVLNSVFNGGVAMVVFFGFITTAIVQSSSITTSLMIPFIAAGIIKIEKVFPMFLGAKLGSTSTTILASFATGSSAAITVAFVHLLFSLIGVFIIYPVKIMRNVSLRLAKGLGNLAYVRRRYAVIFVLSLFFILPGILIFVADWFNK